MIIFYLKTYIKNIKRNTFYFTINLIGFCIGLLTFMIVGVYAYTQFSYDSFHKNAENIYRITAGGYGVTPLCLKENLEGRLSQVKNIVRFSAGEKDFQCSDKKIHIKDIYYVDSSLFEVFSFDLISGNVETPLKEPHSIVLSETLAKRIFMDESAVGKVLKTKEGQIFNVSAIMKDLPENSHLQTEAFASIESFKSQKGSSPLNNCGEWSSLTYIELQEGADLKSTEEFLNTVLEEYRMQTNNGRIPLKLEPLKSIYFEADNNKFDGCKHGDKGTVLIYFGIAVLFLTIVIINSINLNIALLLNRFNEFAIRRINDATKKHIMGQVIFDSLSTTLISSIVAYLLLEMFFHLIQEYLNLEVQIIFLHSRWVLMLFGVIVLFIALISGLFPSLYIIRRLNLKTTRNNIIARNKRLRQTILMTIQIFIIAVLLNCNFIVQKQIDYVLHKDLGQNIEDVMHVQLSEKLQQKQRVLKHALCNLPYIENATFSDANFGGSLAKAYFESEAERVLCYKASVDTEFLRLFEIPLLKGRGFSKELTTDIEQHCVIINKAAAKAFQLFEGNEIVVGGSRVIGIIDEFHFTSMHNKIEPLILYCSNESSHLYLKLKVPKSQEIISELHALLKTLDENYESSYLLLSEEIAGDYLPEEKLSVNLKISSAIMLMIASLGIFALTFIIVKYRRREVCIRKILGAGIQNLFYVMTQGYIRVVLIANAISLPVSYVLMKLWLQDFYYQVGIDAITFLRTFILTSIFVFAAIIVHVLKTMKISPIKIFQSI